MTDQIATTLNYLKKNFMTGKTKPVEWRKQQLRQLLRGIDEMKDEMTAAIQKDLGKSPLVTELTSLMPCKWDVDSNLKHIDGFVQDVKLDTAAFLAPCSSRVRYEPLGVVLIFGSWNYPYVVTLKPLCQAITSGNSAVIKPSEMAPHASAVVKKLVDKYLDNECYKVIEGGVEVAAKICHYPWDLICFTGSTIKGKLVAEAAAKNLTPCILELGGKCPAVIDESADLDLAAGKIAFARFNNSGQTCISTDYVIIHESKVSQFKDILVQKVRQFYGEKPDGSDEMGKVITDWHCDRLEQMIKESGGEKILGGKIINKSLKFVEPTIILNPEKTSSVMQEEIFGPILPIITFKTIDEVIKTINEKDKPLAVYYFGCTGNNKNRDRLMDETSSSAFVQNEVMLHMVNHAFGFGGVGASGYGRYGGYEGFKQFSNPKSVMIKPPTNFYPFNQLVPPYPLAKQNLIRKLTFNSTLTQGQIQRAILVMVVAAVGYLLISNMFNRVTNQHNESVFE